MNAKKTSIFITIFVGLVILLPKTSFGAEQFNRDLSFGLQQDSDVMKLQEFLSDGGFYFGPISGNFFSLTLKAVKSFQVHEGIAPAAGYFGLKTRTQANTLLGAQVQASNQQAATETAQPQIVAPTPHVESYPVGSTRIFGGQNQIMGTDGNWTIMGVLQNPPANIQNTAPLSEPAYFVAEFLPRGPIDTDEVFTIKTSSSNGQILANRLFTVSCDKGLGCATTTVKSDDFGIVKFQANLRSYGRALAPATYVQCDPSAPQTSKLNITDGSKTYSKEIQLIYYSPVGTCGSGSRA